MRTSDSALRHPKGRPHVSPTALGRCHRWHAHGGWVGEGPDAFSERARSGADFARSDSGLERQWFAVVPFVETERLLKISIGGDLLFAQTSYAMVHAFDAESGRLLWSAQLGERTGFARGVASNSFAVFVTNADSFFALDKRTGRMIWKILDGQDPRPARRRATRSARWSG